MDAVVEKNQAIARQFVTEGFINIDLSQFDTLLDPDITVATRLSPSGSIVGSQKYKAAFAEFAEALFVKSARIEDLFGVGDRVVIRFTVCCGLKSSPPSATARDRDLILQEVHIFTFRNSKIVNSIVSEVFTPKDK